mgnify:FL=1
MKNDMASNYAEIKETCRELFYLAKKTNPLLINQIEIVKQALPLYFSIPSDVVTEVLSEIVEDAFYAVSP